MTTTMPGPCRPEKDADVPQVARSPASLWQGGMLARAAGHPRRNEPLGKQQMGGATRPAQRRLWRQQEELLTRWVGCGSEELVG